MRKEHPSHQANGKMDHRIGFSQDNDYPYGYGEGTFDADDGSVVMNVDNRYYLQLLRMHIILHHDYV